MESERTAVHDHTRLRYRGYAVGFGSTFWARGQFDPLPARSVTYPGPVLELHLPDLATLREVDPSLIEVLEERRSLHTHDAERPGIADQLGEFLYRTARTRGVKKFDDVEYPNRTYRVGGGLHELELYPVVREAEGIPPAMYHYDSYRHALNTVCHARDPAVRNLLRAAGWSAARTTEPQVLIVVSTD